MLQLAILLLEVAPYWFTATGPTSTTKVVLQNLSSVNGIMVSWCHNHEKMMISVIFDNVMIKEMRRELSLTNESRTSFKFSTPQIFIMMMRRIFCTWHICSILPPNQFIDLSSSNPVNWMRKKNNFARKLRSHVTLHLLIIHNSSFLLSFDQPSET